MKQKVKLTEGQLKQIVEDASRMVIQEMLGDGSFSREMGDMGRMGRNASKNALNFMPSSSASNTNRLRSPRGPFGFMPNPYAYNRFNGMGYGNAPGMYFPNGFYPGYQG
jgi:hypothetical protein